MYLHFILTKQKGIFGNTENDTAGIKAQINLYLKGAFLVS